MVAAGLVVATVYCVVLFGGHRLTGHPMVDGVLGIVVGLYICTHPVANAIDLLFYRDYFRQPTDGWSGFGWLVLNALCLSMGWLMITAAITLLAPPH
jgi:hypothetical protein